jgi:hypothetical protein
LIDSINRFDFDFDPSARAFQSIDIDRLQVVIDRFDRRSPNSSGVLGLVLFVGPFLTAHRPVPL